MKELLTTHFVDGIFSFNKGTFFTMKEVVFRPGFAPRDFIAGKRKPYFNVFFLLLLVLGLNILIGEVYFDEPWISFSKSNNSIHVNNQWDFNQLYKDNRKLIFFFLVPLMGFYAWLIFRRFHYNLAEHLVFSTFTLAGMAIIYLIIELLAMVEFKFPTIGITIFLSSIRNLLSVIMIGFPILAYFKISWQKYKLLGFVWRIGLLYFCVILSFIFIMTGWVLAFLYIFD